MVKRIRGNAVQAALLLQGIYYPMPQQEAQVVSEFLQLPSVYIPGVVKSLGLD